MVRVYGDEEDAGSIFVHKELISGLSDYFSGEVCQAEEEDEDLITIHVDVGHRACILLARFLYGKPMWSLDDVEHAKDDLKSLVEIYQKTFHYSFYTWNRDCIDACVDAIE